jgi:dTDP-4-dehydrorhamnose 3,5-epimerase
MKFSATPLDGLWVVETLPRGDTRGRLTRLSCERSLQTIRPGLHFRQVNLTRTSQRGTVRGMHFQHAPAAEIKLVRCLRGRVFDVAVDLRAGSATFGRWHAVELSDDNDLQLLIPQGFAHGFQTLTDDVELLYQHSADYDPACEDGVRHDDPALAIAWPLPVTVLSERDRSHRLMDAQFLGVQT